MIKISPYNAKDFSQENKFKKKLYFVLTLFFLDNISLLED